MKRCCVDAGHGGVDNGASFNGLLEKDITLGVAKYLAPLIAGSGYVPLLTRTTDIDLDINQRTKLANDWGCDIFVSIHANADPDDDSPGDPEGKGSEIWVYPGSKKSHSLAEFIRGAGAALFPEEPWRGIKETAHLGVLRYTWMPAVLVEVAFIDTLESYKLADESVQRRIAQALGNGIKGYMERELAV